MTIEELLKAVNATNMTEAQLTKVLGKSLQLVEREEYRSLEAGIRAEAAKVAGQFEAAAQDAHAKYMAKDAELQAP